jgi:HlyD family secretion protein
MKKVENKVSKHNAATKKSEGKIDGKALASKAVISFPLLLLVISLLYIFTSCSSNDNDFVLGFVETTVVDVASEIPGKIEKLFVSKGDIVEEGDTLAIFEPKILSAKVGQAEGIKNMAKAMMEMAQNGLRPQEIEAAKNAYMITKSQYEYADKTFKRVEKLYQDSVVSEQKYDEVRFKHDAARDQMNAAKAIYDMAKEGARKELVEVAAAEYYAAEHLYDEAEAFNQELELISPVSGEISNQIAERGEIVPAGFPVFSVQIPEEAFVIIQVREDLMGQFKKGDSFTGVVPALDNSEFDFYISYIAPMADFANWLPTNDKGAIDLRTFEINLKPKNRIKDLRPGMSVKIML